MADTLEAVVYRQDHTRHIVPLLVEGRYAYSDKIKQGFFISPQDHVAEYVTTFNKKFMSIGIFISAMVPIYFLMIMFAMPTIGIYKVLTFFMFLLAPLVIGMVVRYSLPKLKRQIFCIWNEPEPINLAEPYSWDFEEHWLKIQHFNKQWTSDAWNDVQYQRQKGYGMLTNSLSWVLLSLSILVALVVVVGMIRA